MHKQRSNGASQPALGPQFFSSSWLSRDSSGQGTAYAVNTLKEAFEFI